MSDDHSRERQDLLETLAKHRGFLRQTITGMSDEQIRGLTGWITISGFIGAHLFDVLFYQLSVRNIANWTPPALDCDLPQEWQTMLRLVGIVNGQGPDADIAALDDAVAHAQARHHQLLLGLGRLVEHAEDPRPRHAERGAGGEAPLDEGPAGELSLLISLVRSGHGGSYSQV